MYNKVGYCVHKRFLSKREIHQYNSAIDELVSVLQPGPDVFVEEKVVKSNKFNIYTERVLSLKS